MSELIRLIIMIFKHISSDRDELALFVTMLIYMWLLYDTSSKEDPKIPEAEYPTYWPFVKKVEGFFRSLVYGTTETADNTSTSIITEEVNTKEEEEEDRYEKKSGKDAETLDDKDDDDDDDDDSGISWNDIIEAIKAIFG